MHNDLINNREARVFDELSILIDSFKRIRAFKEEVKLIIHPAC
jgi:hypothetical protein